MKLLPHMIIPYMAMGGVWSHQTPSWCLHIWQCGCGQVKPRPLALP